MYEVDKRPQDIHLCIGGGLGRCQIPVISVIQAFSDSEEAFDS